MQVRFIKIPENIRAELLNLYSEVEGVIQSRLSEFKSFNRSDVDKLFVEMSFCVLTPQSRARAADAAVNELATSGLLFRGTYSQLVQVLRKWGVRFYEVKARYIIRNRHLLRDGGEYFKNMLGMSPFECRELLVKDVWGFGYKEASHFLRNIGFTGLAILDRHILRNMLHMGVIEELPKSLTRKRYLDLEEIFIATAQTLCMSPESLDLLLWYKATGDVFK